MTEAHEAAVTAEEFGFEDDVAELPVAVGWPRILARGVDIFFVYLLFTFGVFIVFGAVVGGLGRFDIMQAYLQQNFIVQAVAPLLLWGLAESFFVLTTGATPGKLLLGLRVVRHDDDASPGAGRSFLRTYWMLFRGMLLGIPLISNFAMLYWTSTLLPPYKGTPWDKRGKTRVVVQRTPGKFAMAVAVLLMAAGMAWSAYAALSRMFG